MVKFLSKASRQNRAILIRHAGLCLASVSAWFWPRAAHIGDRAIWLLTFLVLLNLSASVALSRRGDTGLVPAISTGLGLAGWCALGCVTGGAASPFVAGLWLEVLLSALAFRCWGTILVTAGSLAALAAEWWMGRPASPLGTLIYQGAFLAVMGTVAALLTCHWEGEREDLKSMDAWLQSRLFGLEQELESARRMGRLGEGAARLAHGIKNSVHALRGYAALIREQGDPAMHLSALEGMRACLDRLENVSRTVLGKGPSLRSPAPDSEVGPIIEEVIRDAAVVYPEITWRRPRNGIAACLGVPASVVHEALLNLLRNAAEAMGGRGEVEIGARSEGATFEISVRDRGSGLAEADLRRIFTPGRTTKRQGSGFGLYLTRAILESYGGFLRASSTRGEGSLFAMGLPFRRS